MISLKLVTGRSCGLDRLTHLIYIYIKILKLLSEDMRLAYQGKLPFHYWVNVLCWLGSRLFLLPFPTDSLLSPFFPWFLHVESQKKLPDRGGRKNNPLPGCEKLHFSISPHRRTFNFNPPNISLVQWWSVEKGSKIQLSSFATNLAEPTHFLTLLRDTSIIREKVVKETSQQLNCHVSSLHRSQAIPLVRKQAHKISYIFAAIQHSWADHALFQ